MWKKAANTNKIIPIKNSETSKLLDETSEEKPKELAPTVPTPTTTKADLDVGTNTNTNLGSQDLKKI